MKRTYTRYLAEPSTPTPQIPKRSLPYSSYLTALSQRTGTPLPSLLLSFGILHEITAVLPLFAFFFASRSLGVGEKTVQWATEGEGPAGDMMKRWTREGEAWAGRVGRRYGIFGFEKRKKGEAKEEESGSAVTGELGVKVAGDVANAVVAYGLTKAILPLRIGLSLYLSPWFSRRAVEPVRKSVAGLFARRKSVEP